MLSFVWQELFVAQVSQGLEVQNIIAAQKSMSKCPEVSVPVVGNGGGVLL